MMKRFVLFIGAIMGFGGVAAGALFDHAFPDSMTHVAETALRYHQIYALLITGIGLTLAFADLKETERKYITLGAILFIAGTVLFCGSLYTLALTGIHAFGYVTPFGGITLMAGWIVLGAFALFRR